MRVYKSPGHVNNVVSNVFNQQFKNIYEFRVNATIEITQTP